MSAMSLWRSQSYLGNYYRRKRARNGAPSAITDTAHKLARIIYHLVKTGKQFDESIFNTQETAHQKRVFRSLENKTKSMECQIVPCQQKNILLLRSCFKNIDYVHASGMI